MLRLRAPACALLLLLASAVPTPAAAQPRQARQRPVMVDRVQLRAALARPAVRAELRRAAPRLRLDSTRLAAHVLRPAHVLEAVSDEGPAMRGARPSAASVQRLSAARTQQVVSQHRGLTLRPAVAGRLRAGPSLDVQGFVASLHEALKDNVVGYAVQLRQNGQPIATLQWNWSRRPDDGNQGWTPQRRMHVASVSKLVTAVALVRLLNERNIPYDARVAGWLPAYWTRGSNIDDITFRHLLTHTSGIEVPGSSTDFLTMRQEIAAGVPAVGGSQYENVNFALMRILIPVIDGRIDRTLFEEEGAGAPAGGWVDQVWDWATIDQYHDYMATQVFARAGVPQTVGFDHGAGAALAYGYPAGEGWNSGDLSSVSGGAGWVMSVDEVLDVMGQFRRGGNIVSQQVAQQALEAGFGVDVRMDTPAGRLYNKNGRWQTGDGRAEQSLAYFLPNDMELVVFANSPIGTNDVFFRDLVTGIYQANVH